MLVWVSDLLVDIDNQCHHVRSFFHPRAHVIGEHQLQSPAVEEARNTSMEKKKGDPWPDDMKYDSTGANELIITDVLVPKIPGQHNYVPYQTIFAFEFRRTQIMDLYNFSLSRL
jgi:hypothetical protein